MSAHNCGCDPEAKWHCANFPDCSYGKVMRENYLAEDTMSETTDVERPKDVSSEAKVAMVKGLIERAVDSYDRERENAVLADALTLNGYQRSLHTYKDRHHECHALGLVGEVAEVVVELKNDPRMLSIDRDVFIAAGNIADMVKKATAHGVALDRDKLKKELGDVLWYIGAVASDNNLTLGEIAIANTEKLRARYPEGFVKGGGVRNVVQDVAAKIPEKRDGAVLRELERQGVVEGATPSSVNLRTAQTHAVHFGCGCSEVTDAKGVLSRTYCPNGECRRLAR